MTERIIAVLLVACACLAPAAGAARETADEDIDQAIGALRRYIWGQQKEEGHWVIPPYTSRGGKPGGFPTALATLALLEAGEKFANNSPMEKALAALTKIKTNNVEVRSVRVMALSRVVGTAKKSPYRRQLVEDVRWLARGGGSWGVNGPEQIGDNSSNQYVMMALWEAKAGGVRIPSGIIHKAEGVWVGRQGKDGGWAYSNLEDLEMTSTPRMTAAGLASMYICRDSLGKACRPYRHQKTLDSGWDYLNKNFKKNFVSNSYTAFCIQRVGMSSGKKFIGGVDWYAIAAAELAKPKPFGKAYSGYYGSLIRACYELIVLARGRLPLIFNKLNYGGAESNWNFHPRDVARFSEYMRRQLERPMRWQVVKISDDVQTLLDAPIMLVTGNEAMALTPEQWNLLRQYTLRGGMLLFVPTHGSSAFLESAQKALADLYLPQRKSVGKYYQLEKLPEKHPLYDAYKKVPNGLKRLPMSGVSDGTRLLAMICEKDITCAWHKWASVSGRINFLAGVNLFVYATGPNEISSRLRPVFTGIGSAKASYTVNVAWLKHGGNWSTQPYALNYLSQKLTVDNRVELKISAGCPITKAALEGKDLLWMTGSDEFTLSKEELSALKEYLDGGGTLLVNAVGGAEAFDGSAQTMLRQLFRGRGYLPADSPLLTGKCGEFRGIKLEGLVRTTAFRRAFVRAPQPMRGFGRRRGGRIQVIYLPFGVHDTLDGHTAHGARSYMPASARAIAANVVLYAMTSGNEGKKPE